MIENASTSNSSAAVIAYSIRYLKQSKFLPLESVPAVTLPHHGWLRLPNHAAFVNQRLSFLA